MRTQLLKRGQGGVTLLEILVVIAVIGLMAALYLPAVAQSRHRARQSACLNNLRQVGVAYVGFAQDHHDFPMRISTAQGGTLEFVNAAGRLSGPFYFAYRHFQAISNELTLPKMLICPVDLRPPAADFVGLRNDNLSFIINVAADVERSDSVLSGDRNIAKTDGVPDIALRLAQGETVKWSDELHQNRGNLLFSDGHVEGTVSAGLERSLHASLNTVTGVVGSIWMPSVAANGGSRAN